MAVLTAIVTHLDGPSVRRQLEHLEALAPGSRFVVCHGGGRADFEELGVDGALFVDDATLRGPNKEQSYNAILRGVYEERVVGDETVDLVYFVEYDQLFLRGDFERTLAALSERTGADLLAKRASPRNDTNWPHFVRYRSDERLDRFFAHVSRRSDPGARWGCLGSGMLFRRDALAAFCSITDPPHAYLEMFIPTLVHHLGFEVVDADAHSDLYAAVRWRPEYGVDETIAEKRAGRTFVHPFKRFDALDEIRTA